MDREAYNVALRDLQEHLRGCMGRWLGTQDFRGVETRLIGNIVRESLLAQAAVTSTYTDWAQTHDPSSSALSDDRSIVLARALELTERLLAVCHTYSEQDPAASGEGGKGPETATARPSASGSRARFRWLRVFGSRSSR